MARYADMSKEEIAAELKTLREQYDAFSALGLSLNMARGKPSAAQLDLSKSLLSCLDEGDYFSEDGTDCRNYGVLDGIDEAKRLMSVLLDDEPENVIVLGNSSLTVMYDTVARCINFGCLGSEPWGAARGAARSAGKPIKFICPVPGYDRHFAILERFGIEMIPVPMLEGEQVHDCADGICRLSVQGAGPDMDEIERLVATDAQIKGIWCVPKYANPTGITYSDDVVRRLASMECAAPDFRIFWDNAYAVHHLYDEPERDHLLDIGAACTEAGNPNRYFKFASTSKITFPGAGICGFAASEENVAEAKRLLGTQIISADKLNQLRHVRFFGGKAAQAAQAKSTTVEAFASAIDAHMKKQAAILEPKFQLVQTKLLEGLMRADIATWSDPRGGYFVSFDGLEGTAKRTVELAKGAGVILTGAGATWPCGHDPRDSNIRIAPTMPPLEELVQALDVFVCCAKIAALEVLQG